jgi:hypothetical protein
VRSIASPLAAVLSILMVSAPAFASSCDLSCWLRQTHSDCHAVVGATPDKDAAMSSRMDMGPENGDGMAMDLGSGVSMNGMPGHSMSMSPQTKATAWRSRHAMKPEIPADPMPENSKALPLCAHGTCSQISASTSPPGGEHSQPDSVPWAAAAVSNPATFWTGFPEREPGTPLPEVRAGNRLLITLRI